MRALSNSILDIRVVLEVPKLHGRVHSTTGELLTKGVPSNAQNTIPMSLMAGKDSHTSTRLDVPESKGFVLRGTKD